MPFPTPPVSFNCSFSSSEVYVKLKCLYWFPFIECEAKAGGFYIVRRNTATCIQLYNFYLSTSWSIKWMLLVWLLDKWKREFSDTDFGIQELSFPFKLKVENTV